MQRIVREESRLQRGGGEVSGLEGMWTEWESGGGEMGDVVEREGKRGEGVRRWRKTREGCRREKGAIVERDASKVEREMGAVVERG